MAVRDREPRRFRAGENVPALRDARITIERACGHHEHRSRRARHARAALGAKDLSEALCLGHLVRTQQALTAQPAKALALHEQVGAVRRAAGSAATRAVTLHQRPAARTHLERDLTTQA